MLKLAHNLIDNNMIELFDYNRATLPRRISSSDLSLSFVIINMERDKNGFSLYIIKPIYVRGLKVIIKQL